MGVSSTENMRLQILSDLHLEFHADGGKSFLASLDPEGVDVLVIAGDLGLVGHLLRALDALCRKYPEVVYVVGNHEYYNSSPGEVHEQLGLIEGVLPNLHWLHHSNVVLKDPRTGKICVFAGTPLWFPKTPDTDTLKGWLNDFQMIEGFEPWVYRENQKAEEFLHKAAPKADVVVTHHLPSYLSVPDRHIGQKTNCFFVCPVEGYMGDRQLWVHGHTHDSCWYKAGDTQVVCNPFGYAGRDENPHFNDKLVVEVI